MTVIKNHTHNNTLLDKDTPTPTPTEIDKKIIYPIFTECAQFTIDPYWQQVFEECSKGHFPRGSGNKW